MKNYNKITKISIFILSVLFIFTSCKKEEKNTIKGTHNFENFHIKQLDKELNVLSKSFSKIFSDKNNVAILKKAIYVKKKDENITIKDFYKFFDSYNPKVTIINTRTEQFYDNFEEMLYDKYNEISPISLNDFRNMINTYDMSIYWEFIERWDGIKKPIVGYPIDDEDDVNHNYDLLSYNIINIDSSNSVIQNTYIQNNPVILIRPNEDFENGSPNYYSNIPYIWLEDILKDSALSNSNQRTEDIMSVDRFRLETFSTNGNKFDGNGGPEFRFFMKSPTSPTTGFYAFNSLISINLSAGAAQGAGTQTPIKVYNYVNNILHDNWHLLDFRILTGAFEEDGGAIKNQQISGNGIKIDLAGIQINVILGSTIHRKDDIIDRYEMYRSSFVNHVQLRQNWGWGFLTLNHNGIHILPIRQTNHTDLKVTYRNY